MTSWIGLIGEVRKELMLLRSYWFSTVFDVVGYSMLYVAAMFFLGQGEFPDDLLAGALIGFIVSYFVLETLDHMTRTIEFEAEMGTLEQMMMGAVSPIWLLVGQVISVHIKGLIGMLLMAVAFILLFDIDASIFQLETIPILLIILLGVMGFGFVMAGMAIIFKQVGSLSNALFNIILFLNGTFLPVEAMPRWLQIGAQILPTTQGIIVIRAVAEDATLMDTMRDGSFFLLLLHSALYLVLGIAFFQFAQWRAKGDGSLGHY